MVVIESHEGLLKRPAPDVSCAGDPRIKREAFVLLAPGQLKCSPIIGMAVTVCFDSELRFFQRQTFI